MSTPFILGPTTAHVARFSDRPGEWESNCGYRVKRPWQELRWTGDHERLVPWCKWCIGRVATLARDVLEVDPVSARLLNDENAELQSDLDTVLGVHELVSKRADHAEAALRRVEALCAAWSRDGKLLPQDWRRFPGLRHQIGAARAIREAISGEQS